MQVKSSNPPLISTPSHPAVTPVPHAGTGGVSDHRITAIEQRVAELETLVQAFASVLTVSTGGNKATLHAATVEVQAGVSLTLAGGVNVVVDSGVQVKLKSMVTKLQAASSLEIVSDGQAELRASGQTRINGSQVTLNNGTKAVARAGDTMAGFGGGIAGGNPTVLA
jgi:aromatic ring hydroxylase